MTNRPLLVFGASGFVGRTLTDACADATRPVAGVSRAECDITDREAIDRTIGRFRPDVIVNAAAFSNVDRAEQDRAGATAANAEGPRILASAAVAFGIPLIHISSDYVFDGRQQRPYTEGDPVGPLGHYGRTKAEGEEGVRAVHPQHVILRTAWLFGRHGGGFARAAVEAALQQRPIRAIADQTGSPTAAIDLAGAVLAVDTAIRRSFRLWGTFHYAGSEPARRLDMAEVIRDAFAAMGDPVPTIVPVSLADFAGAAPRPVYSALDSIRFSHTFGLAASDWRDRLAEFVREEAGAMTEPPVS